VDPILEKWVSVGKQRRNEGKRRRGAELERFHVLGLMERSDLARFLHRMTNF